MQNILKMVNCGTFSDEECHTDDNASNQVPALEHSVPDYA
jgi:hypothetical protein